MARVYKKPLYRPVPDGAKIVKGQDGKRYAYWIDGGREYTAEYVESKNGPRIVEESEYFIARYTDATGRFRERSTGCRDLRSAEHKLNTWLQEIEKVKAGILSQEEFEISKRVNDMIEDQLPHFEDHLRAKGASPRYIDETLTRTRKLCTACKFKRMIEMNSTTLLRWLNRRTTEGMGARTRNAYREVMNTFSNWAVRNHCLANNPFGRIPKIREAADKRHERRALNDTEIAKLFDAAEARPLTDMTVLYRGKRERHPETEIKQVVRDEAVMLGLERKLIYATMIYTGLRKSELASITVGQVFLETEIPHFVLKAKDEKARRGATLPLHPELASQLRRWLELRKTKDAAKSHDKLFSVPDGLSKILNRDLVFAGIDKRDTLGRVIDVHSLRHTHASLLARRGVSPTIAQQSMRHSDMRLTMGVYTHLELGEIAEGVNRIPDFLGEKKDGDN